MADTIRNVSIRLAVENGQVVKAELDSVGNAGSSSLGRIAAGANAAGSALRLLGPVIGALSTGALFGFVKSAIDTAGGLGELAQSAGVSTDALQALQFGAVSAGVGAAEMQKGIERLTRTIADAATGNASAARGFREIGIAFEDSSGNIRSTEAVLADVADAVQRARSPFEQAAIATTFFGDRLGQRLIPLLSQGRQGLQEVVERAISFGAVIDSEVIARADEASDKIAELTTAFSKLGTTILASAAPALTAVANALAKIAQGPSLRDQSNAFAAEIGLLQEQLKTTEEALARGGLGRAQEESLRDQARSLRSQIETLGGVAGAIQEQRQALEGRAARVLNPDGPQGAPRPRPNLSGGGGESEEDKLRKRLADKALAEVLAADRKLFQERDRLIAASVAPQSPIARYQQRLEELGRLVEELQERGSPLPDSAITFEAEAALAAYNKELENTAASTSTAKDLGRDLGFTFSSAFEDAVIEGKNLRDVVTGLGKDIARIIARRTITEPLSGALSGAVSGIGEGIGKFFSGLLASAKGSAFDNGAPVTAFANGGILDRPTFFPFRGGVGVAGEAGTEGIFPLRRDANGRLGVMASGGGGITITQNIDARGADPNSAAQLRAISAQIIDAALAAVVEDRRRGGNTKKAFT